MVAGGRYIDAGLAEQIPFAASGCGPYNQHDALTDRELQVMRLLVCGLSVTRVAAPPSTKNQSKALDPEMHKSKKGKEWHFGMKMHFDVDAASDLTHSLVTAAGTYDAA